MLQAYFKLKWDLTCSLYFVDFSYVVDSSYNKEENNAATILPKIDNNIETIIVKSNVETVLENKNISEDKGKYSKVICRVNI